jgi:hypothetical protein
MHLIGRDHVERLDPKVPAGLFKLDKLTASEHLGKAAHVSRHFTPIFEKKFMPHVAPEYTPLRIANDMERPGEGAGPK